MTHGRVYVWYGVHGYFLRHNRKLDFTRNKWESESERDKATDRGGHARVDRFIGSRGDLTIMLTLFCASFPAIARGKPKLAEVLKYIMYSVNQRSADEGKQYSVQVPVSKRN